MMKFFRKHNKKLLAVFMVLLMIVFLGGSALDNLLQPSGDRVFAESAFGPISNRDHRSAEITTDILGALGMDWQRPVGGIGQPLELVDWILLTREAELLGLKSSTTAVRSSFAAALDIDRISRQLRRKPERILYALAQYKTIRQTARMVGQSAVPSEAEVLAGVRSTLKKVKIRAALIPAKAFENDAAEVSEAEIEAQFASGKDRKAGPGIEFGYYVPDAVKVQYVKVDRNAIAEAMKTSRAAYLEKKAKSFHAENRQTDPRFRRPPEPPKPEGESDEPVEGPEPVKPPYLDWEEAKEIALDAIALQEAKQASERIIDWLLPYLSGDWLDLERGDDGYRTAPEEVADAGYYEEVLGKMPRTIAYPQAVSIGATAFFSQGEAAEVSGLGSAYFRPTRGRSKTLSTLAFQTKEIVPEVPTGKGVNRAEFVATHQTCPYPLTGADGNTYVFRVIDVREGHVPESVEEVRDEVVESLRLLNGYAEATKLAQSLAGFEDAETLKDAYEMYDVAQLLEKGGPGTGGGYFEPQPIARVNRYQAALGEKTPTTYVSGIGSIPAEAIEQCFALEESEDKRTVIELKDRAAVLAVEWVETQLTPSDEFDDIRVDFTEQMLRARTQDAAADWLNPDNIRARNGFKLAAR